MCPFVEKKEKNIVFSLTYRYILRNCLHCFFNPAQPPPIINNYYNVQPPLPSPPIIQDLRVNVLPIFLKQKLECILHTKIQIIKKYLLKLGIYS